MLNLDNLRNIYQVCKNLVWSELGCFSSNNLEITVWNHFISPFKLCSPVGAGQECCPFELVFSSFKHSVVVGEPHECDLLGLLVPFYEVSSETAVHSQPFSLYSVVVVEVLLERTVGRVRILPNGRTKRMWARVYLPLPCSNETCCLLEKFELAIWLSLQSKYWSNCLNKLILGILHLDDNPV